MTLEKLEEILNLDEFYELVLCTVAETLATKMMSDEVMLLSTLYQLFKDTVGVEAKNQSDDKAMTKPTFFVVFCNL